MANRKIHNTVAEAILGSDKEIDKTNQKIDAPYKIMGRYHRRLYHNPNPLSPDSLLINQCSVKKELIRQVHIAVDKNKDLSDMYELYLLAKKIMKW